jgi:hypothetical protein
MKKIIYPLLMILAACTQTKQTGLVYYNDFESIKGWTAGNLSSKYAHSGIFSNELDSIHMYGITFIQPFHEISTEKVGRVKVSMWALMADSAKGSMVVEVRNPAGKVIMWESRNLDQPYLKNNKWQMIRSDFLFREDSINKPENTVAVYAWNNGKKEFYVDDIRIEFVLGKSHY